MTSLESKIECLKSNHPRDIEDRFVYIREILKLIDNGQASIKDLQTYSPSLFLNELDYSYEGCVDRHTKYGNSADIGFYRSRTADTSRILWMFGDSRLIQQAIMAMSALIDFLNNDPGIKKGIKKGWYSDIPSKSELMLLEMMKSGDTYPLDWPAREAQWWKDDEQRLKNRKKPLRHAGFVAIFVVGLISFVLLIFLLFNKESQNASSIPANQSSKPSTLASTPLPDKSLGGQLDASLFCGVWKVVATQSNDHCGCNYLKIVKVGSDHFKLGLGSEYNGEIYWTEAQINNADGIYLRSAGVKLIGQFVSSNFYPTHGEDFTYKIACEINSDNELVFSVWCSIDGDKAKTAIYRKIHNNIQ